MIALEQLSKLTTFGDIHREANVLLLMTWLSLCEDEDYDLLYGSRPSRPAKKTLEELRAEAEEIWDSWVTDGSNPGR